MAKIQMRALTLFIAPYARRIGLGMRGKPFLTSMSLGDSAYTTVVVLNPFRKSQGGDVNVRENSREFEKESERRSSLVCLVPVSFYHGLSEFCGCRWRD